jgi:hypothetical protein
LILVLTIFSLIVAAGLILPLKPATHAVLLRVDFLICVLFLIDFLLSLRRAERSSAMLSDLSIIQTYRTKIRHVERFIHQTLDHGIGGTLNTY